MYYSHRARIVRFCTGRPLKGSFKVILPGKNLLPGGAEPYRLVVTLFGAEPLVDLVAVGTFSLGSRSWSVGGSAMKGGRTNTTLGMGASLRLTFLTWGNFFWALEEPNTKLGRVLFLDIFSSPIKLSTSMMASLRFSNAGGRVSSTKLASIWSNMSMLAWTCLLSRETLHSCKSA